MIRLFSASPLSPPAMLTSVGSQSSEAKMSFLTVPGLMTPGQRTSAGARMPPSQVVSLPPLNGVTPPSGKVMVSAPLSVVNTMIVLSSSPMSSSFFSTTPILSSSCFMPASLRPQSLPPCSPIMAAYLSFSTVVMCMRAGLYQTKNGLLVFFGSLRSRKSMTLAEISSSTPFERSSVNGPWSMQFWVLDDAIGLAPQHVARRRQANRGSRIDRARHFRDAGDRRVPARRRNRLLGRGLVDVREAHALHRIEVIQIAPEFLEAVRGRQRVGVIAEMVLAELAGVVAEIEQEFRDRRRAGPQIGRAAGQLRRDHAGAQRMHAGEEGIAARRAALLGVIMREQRAFIADAIDVRRLARPSGRGDRCSAA